MRNAKLVEQAACLCSAVASIRVMSGTGGGEEFTTLANGYSTPTARLAMKAMDAAWSQIGIDMHGQRWALACSMLRNGEVSP